MKGIVCSVMFIFAIGFVNAQNTINFSAKSGDAELDISLADLNAKAKLDLSVFKKDMSVSFGITEGKLDKFLVTMQPADVFMSLQIGKLVSKPVDEVVKSYEKNKSKGWGVIAKEMGIKPGSKEFHELKGNAKAKGHGKPDGKGNGGGNGKGNGKGKGKSK